MSGHSKPSTSGARFRLTCDRQEPDNGGPGDGFECAGGPLRETSTGMGCAPIPLGAFDPLFDGRAHSESQ
jgi:hypothetical protein